jgi:hypothetical protein
MRLPEYAIFIVNHGAAELQFSDAGGQGFDINNREKQGGHKDRTERFKLNVGKR